MDNWVKQTENWREELDDQLNNINKQLRYVILHSFFMLNVNWLISPSTVVVLNSVFFH